MFVWMWSYCTSGDEGGASYGTGEQTGEADVGSESEGRNSNRSGAIRCGGQAATQNSFPSVRHCKLVGVGPFDPERSPPHDDKISGM